MNTPTPALPAVPSTVEQPAQYVPEPRIYRIIRFRRSGTRRTIRNNVTLTEAQNHCEREDTHKPGVWFDGYDYMPGCRPRD